MLLWLNARNNVHAIVTMLSGNVTNVHETVTVLSSNVINMHSSLGENFHSKLFYFISNTLDVRLAVDVTTCASLNYLLLLLN